jgi:hypothetical protein
MVLILDIEAAMNIMPAILLASIFSGTPAPAVTCHGATVSYRFVGVSGTVFTYGGHQYAVPTSGWIELVKERSQSVYLAGGKSLPLDVWPIDGFGTRRVPLPQFEAPATPAEGVSR